MEWRQELFPCPCSQEVLKRHMLWITKHWHTWAVAAVHAPQAEGIGTLNETESSAALERVKKNTLKNILFYSKSFHKLHRQIYETSFSGYKPISSHCLSMMSCLFCTCLQIGQMWVPECFSPFLMLMTGALSGQDWLCPVQCSELILFSFCLHNFVYVLKPVLTSL